MARSFDKIPIILGELIKKHRLRKNISQAELALNAGINVSYLSTVECGYSYISISKFLDLCEALDLSPVYVMHEFTEEIKKIDDLDRFKDKF